MDERWVQSYEFPEYSISSFGRVSNDAREIILKPSINKGGVHKINFWY